jgi:16S rRNA (cytosine1402-N4)-methyltransferase
MAESIQNHTFIHEPVLTDEVLSLLDLKGKRNVVDATLGLGGHAKIMLEKMPKSGKLIGFDADHSHIKVAKKNLRIFKDQVIFVNNNFVEMEAEMKKTKVRSIDAILFDLGIASPHVDFGERGFSFLREGPLDMRFNQNTGRTAADVLNDYSEKELVRIFFEYGEERNAKKIAREILKRRKWRKIKTTTQLAEFIEKTVGRHGKIHPATRIFQALRIEVNNELEVLPEGLRQAVALLKKGGRVAVISYHSLEDRIVKNYFRELSRMESPMLKLLTKKPVVPSDEEISRNPRSRSAKLRVAEKLI